MKRIKTDAYSVKVVIEDNVATCFRRLPNEKDYREIETIVADSHDEALDKADKYVKEWRR